ncbi:MAG: parallel beta-helix domain-containing protein [Sandaracinaceae bacterium]
MRKLSLLLTSLSLAACGSGNVIHVDPSSDDQTAIQTAFVDVEDDMVIELGAGTYTLTDALELSNHSGVTLRGAGMGQTTLDFSGQVTGGAGVDMMNMTNVLVEGLTILDAAGNGLRISNSEGVVIRGVSAGWTAEDSVDNGKYAIYPVSSQHVLIEDCEAFNSADAGLYVGQVQTCIVRNSRAHGNVAGIEIENSTDCEVYGNTAEDNTGGILVFELPTLPRRGGGTLVTDNMIRNNNRVNFGDPTTTVGLVPAGSGLFILAANDVEISNNTIEGNRGVASTVISYQIISALTGEAPPDDPGYDPYSEGIYIHDNTYSGNGDMPGSMTPDGSNDALRTLLGLMAAAGTTLTTVEEITWDGFLADGSTPADVLCAQNNAGAEFRLLDLPGLLGDGLMTNTDITPHDCMGTPRPRVDEAFAGFAALED